VTLLIQLLDRIRAGLHDERGDVPYGSIERSAVARHMSQVWISLCEWMYPWVKTGTGH
jgi:hypothetical protein